MLMSVTLQTVKLAQPLQYLVRSVLLGTINPTWQAIHMTINALNVLTQIVMNVMELNMFLLPGESVIYAK
jgi:hypothetical protein